MSRQASNHGKRHCHTIDLTSRWTDKICSHANILNSPVRRGANVLQTNLHLESCHFTIQVFPVSFHYIMAIVPVSKNHWTQVNLLVVRTLRVHSPWETCFHPHGPRQHPLMKKQVKKMNLELLQTFYPTQAPHQGDLRS